MLNVYEIRAVGRKGGDTTIALLSVSGSGKLYSFPLALVAIILLNILDKF